MFFLCNLLIDICISFLINVEFCFFEIFNIKDFINECDCI